MEANQTTCPQCGLANNALAEACIQCGIIFMKKSATETHARQDHLKGNVLEKAKTKPAATPKPPLMDAFTNEIIQRPNPHEDTVEMSIPKESDLQQKSEATEPIESKPEADKDSGSVEIEMEAIEAAMESVSEAVDAEALFLSEFDPDPPAQTTAPGAAQQQGGLPSESEKADNHRGEAPKSEADNLNRQEAQVEAPSRKQPADSSTAEIKSEKSPIDKETGETQDKAAESAKTQRAATQHAEDSKADDHSVSGVAAQPAEPETKPEEKPGPTMPETPAAPAETKAAAEGIIELPEALPKEMDRDDQQAEKAKRDALKRQHEAQMKAEAMEKQKAAEVLKKKKLAEARAEALRNQRAAEIKAEALKKKKEALARAQASKKQEATRAREEVLKKQKEAQAKIEASSSEISLASHRRPQGAAASMNHHERLLGLLKRYKGKAIGINYDNSSEIREAELVDANEEFFSVRVKDKKLQYSYPLKTILTIVEGHEGVETGDGDKKAKFEAVIKVYPLVLS